MHRKKNFIPPYKFSCFIGSFLLFALFLKSSNIQAQHKNARDFGIEIGIIPTGAYNAITDVAGVQVGQVTLVQGDSVRTGVTAILPHSGNIFQQKVPAAIFVANGFGKLAGFTQVKELGNIETPILLTNTLSVPTVADALIDYTLSFEENKKVRSVNPVVGETNDGTLNDIRGRHVTKKEALEAIKKAKSGEVQQGNVGAGTGTVCFNFKGGIGTSSRKLPKKWGSYTIGVLVQTNYGGVLQIAGVPVGLELNPELRNKFKSEDTDGSCMVVVATDAPLDARNLERLANRALLGIARTGGTTSNGSGEYIIAFSTDPNLRVPFEPEEPLQGGKTLDNSFMTPLFQAVAEATEEAILNSLFHAKTTEGFQNSKVEALPVEKVLEIMKNYGRIESKTEK